MWMLTWLACSFSGGEEPTVPASNDVQPLAMQNHQVAVHRARDALIAQDLEGVRRAGESLAVERVVPYVPPPAQDALHRVQAAGARLARIGDLDVAAEELVTLTQTCARCHTMLEVPASVPLQATQRDVLWTALAFDSDEHWQEGARRDPSLQGLRYWEDRRLAVTLRLQGGRF